MQSPKRALNLKDKRIFIANWKMNQPYSDSLSFSLEHRTALEKLCTQSSSHLIICPSFVALPGVLALTRECTGISIAAQGCSPHPAGSFSAQVDALSLAEAGCQFVIIGHPEHKRYLHETDSERQERLLMTLMAGLNPIVCIGETAAAYAQGTTLAMLVDQLTDYFQTIATSPKKPELCLIAYEPLWFSQTQTLPPIEVIAHIMYYLSTWCVANAPVPVALVYGGGVDSSNAGQLLSITHLNGLLIGKASLEFDELVAIIRQNYS